MISRETLRAGVYNLIMGYDGPDGRWVEGVVNFQSDDVEFDRLTDSILAWFAAPDVRREVVEQEMGYRLRTVAAYYYRRGQHGKVPDPAFIAREIQSGTDAMLAALPAPPVVGDEQACEHCPDGHENPESRPWAVFVAMERDGDGQPTHLYVAPTAGQHVAESDAEWARARLNYVVDEAEIEAAATVEARVRFRRQRMNVGTSRDREEQAFREGAVFAARLRGETRD